MHSRILLLVLSVAVPLTAVEAAGLLSHLGMGRNNQASQPQPDPQQMNCQQLASMPNAPMTVAQCESMMGMAQSGQAALNNRSAARPGDELMSCADITAEMQTLNVSGVSEAHRQQGNTAAGNLQAETAKQQREVSAIAARENAEVQAAMAADRATELSSGGLVKGRAASRVEQRQLEENRKTGERMAKEMAPKQQAALVSVTDSGNDMVQSMQANPRFARLVSLAGSKNCH
jgi:hypothetical protein